MGTQPLPQKRAEPLPIFGQFLLRPNGWMHQDATWYTGRLQLRGLGSRGPSPLNFRLMFIIVIVISLEHCTVVIGLFKFKFYSTLCILFVEKSLIVLSLFQYKYWSEYIYRVDYSFSGSGRGLNHWTYLHCVRLCIDIYTVNHKNVTFYFWL